MRVTYSLDTALTPTAVALGNFDGIHQGHYQVIKALRDASSGLGHCHVTVVTFDPHPQAFFSGQPQMLLTPLSEKTKLLEQLGVEQLVLLPFNQEFASLPPQAFVKQILVDQLAVQTISVGFNFCFGYRRAGTAEDLVKIAGQYDVPVNILSPQTTEGLSISSSAIRKALQAGELSTANQMLGRSYTLIGSVIRGQKLGRTLGFPTANLQLPDNKFLPRQGVYSVRVEQPDWSHMQMGVMNLGRRPTVEGTQTTVEVHLLDWSGDLYGHTLTVSLEKFLRPEQKFASLEALKTQIRSDCEAARLSLTSRAYGLASGQSSAM